MSSSVIAVAAAQGGLLLILLLTHVAGYDTIAPKPPAPATLSPLDSENTAPRTLPTGWVRALLAATGGSVSVAVPVSKADGGKGQVPPIGTAYANAQSFGGGNAVQPSALHTAPMVSPRDVVCTGRRCCVSGLRQLRCHRIT